LSAQLRLSFAPAPTAYYQQVHLGLYQDDDNYIEVGSSYNSGMNMTLETSGSPNGLPSVSASGTLFYFQLNRNPVSGAITGLGSMDGVNWTGLGSSSQALANPRLMIWTGGSVPPYASGSPNCDLSGLTLVASNSVPVPRRFSYQLVSPPAGASIDTNGIITWRPALGQGIGTNLITTVVADNGVPPFYVTNSFSVVVLSRPMIAASTAANSVALAWPGDLTGCQLQTTTNLGPGSQWQPVTNAPQSINGRWTVTIQPLNGRSFYRLLQP
jgi:hypothetical protein